MRSLSLYLLLLVTTLAPAPAALDPRSRAASRGEAIAAHAAIRKPCYRATDATVFILDGHCVTSAVFNAAAGVVVSALELEAEEGGFRVLKITGSTSKE